EVIARKTHGSSRVTSPQVASTGEQLEAEFRRVPFAAPRFVRETLSNPFFAKPVSARSTGAPPATGISRKRVQSSVATKAQRPSSEYAIAIPSATPKRPVRIQPSHGPLEYAVLGEGLPLVVMHGSGGGVRQGLVMRYLLDTRRIQIIALSRPG